MINRSRIQFRELSRSWGCMNRHQLRPLRELQKENAIRRRKRTQRKGKRDGVGSQESDWEDGASALGAHAGGDSREEEGVWSQLLGGQG